MTNPTTTEPHAAYPVHLTRSVKADGMLATCAGCGATIRYIVRDHPAPGQPSGGWRHARPPLRPVRSDDVVTMADRLSDAARDRAYVVADGKTDGVEYERARRTHERRFKALRRLAEALEARGGLR